MVRKDTWTDSDVNTDSASISYCIWNIIIVYYNSYMQSFFEEFVKFVSVSQNFIYKAMMATKMAQIKHMAELELPDDDPSDGDKTSDPQSLLPVASNEEISDLSPLKYINIRQL